MSFGTPSFVDAGIDAAVFHVDSVEFTDYPVREYSITGWCGDSGMQPYREMWLQADGKRVPCLTGLERSDVARELKHPSMRRCGFAACVRVSDVDSRLQFFDSESGGRRLFGVWNARQWIGDKSSDRDSPLRPDTEVGQPLFRPLISVFVTGLDTLHPYYRHRCDTSLSNQTYDKWERVSDCSGAAAGEFVVFLNSQDELHPDALSELVRQINLTPDADLIYSDEDRIDNAGRYLETISQSAYDEDLLLASNYIENLVCVRLRVLDDLGELTFSRSGAWDLLLRIVERTRASQIQHIAKPLYRARRRDPSDSEPDASYLQVARACVKRRSLAAIVEPGIGTHTVRLKRPVSSLGGIALLTRLEHGDQRCAISRTNRPEGMKRFEVSFSSVHRLQDTSPDPILTWTDLNAKVLIFINCPLETLGHDFLNELASQCQRPDCGLVGQDANRCEETAVRSVPDISSGFFAVKSVLLSDRDTWNLLRTGAWSQLCKIAADECRRRNLKILTTPYAIAQVRRGWE